ncbi:MAG: UPF0755 protein [Myxococcota bacterium]
MIARIVLGLGVLGLAAALVGGYFITQSLRPVQTEGKDTAQLFRIEPGQGFGQVARRLESEGLIQDSRTLSLLARYRGDTGKLKVGEYEISANWSGQTILDRLVSGRVKTYEVVVPEGMRATEIAVRLEEAGLADRELFLEAVYNEAFVRSLGLDASSLEGYLYPETYRMPRHLSAQEVAGIFVAQFKRVWADLAKIAAQQSLSRVEIVTLASIIEKETAAPEERPLIASVFHNRLKKRMRLETDPTVIYGIKDFDGNITRKHLRDDTNVYNTYRISGLPPGPIASPGIEALRAAIQPAQSDFLYFVSRNNGTHKFSKTYREHSQAVSEFQLRRRSRNTKR